MRLAGPSMTISRTVSSASACHFRWSAHPLQPWKGVGPIQLASSSSRLAAAIERSLSDELKIPPLRVVDAPFHQLEGVGHEIRRQRRDSWTSAGADSDGHGSHGRSSPRLEGEHTAADSRRNDRGTEARRRGVGVQLVRCVSDPPESWCSWAGHSSCTTTASRSDRRPARERSSPRNWPASWSTTSTWRSVRWTACQLLAP